MPVYKDKKKGYWYIILTENYKQKKIILWNGDYLYTKQQAITAESQYKAQQHHAITTLDLFHEYLKMTKGSLKPTSKNIYDKFERNFFFVIKPISELKPIDILKWKNKIEQIDAGIEYKNRQLGIIRGLLAYGNTMYNIPGNLQQCLLEPLKNNEISVLEEKTKYLPPNEFKRLMEHISDVSNSVYYETAIKVLYNTGLRIGELAALTTDDYKDNYLLINKDYARVGAQDYIQPPKSKNSVRKVYLDQDTKMILDAYIQQYKPNDVLFRLEGAYLNQQKLRRVLTWLSQQDDFSKYDISPHTLRHSHASNLRVWGVDEFLIAKRLGNTPKVATEIYTHSTEDELQKITEKMVKLS